MNPVLLKLTLLFCVFVVSKNSFAGSERVRTTAQQSVEEIQNGVWIKGENTIVQMSGQRHQNLGECKVFEIKLDADLNFNFECEGFSQKGLFNLKNAENLTFIKTRNQITITRYNFIVKKPQTSQLEQALIKIPYVEEVIHIKFNLNGDLAFYLENFELDHFGRIVHKSLFQLHGLKKAEIKVSQTSKNEKPKL